jgi:hypothetical protein
MIKRNYFMRCEWYKGGGEVAHAWRRFVWVSWFSQDAVAFETKQAEIAKSLGCNPEDLIISAFNRV